MSNSIPRPCRIEWSGPERWTVWADEDGVHVRSRSGDALEQCDVEALFTLWNYARQDMNEGQVRTPQRPTRDQIREMGHHAEEATRRRITRAIAAEFGTTDPF